MFWIDVRPSTRSLQHGILTVQLANDMERPRLIKLEKSNRADGHRNKADVPAEETCHATGQHRRRLMDEREREEH